MASKPSKDEEITDSTDWLPTPLPKLSAVDSALRCQVCKEFFRTPMITSCSHTFCSICIRRCLNNDQRCPACRERDQELKLRPNKAMEELVDAFISARRQVLDFARNLGSQESPKRKLDDTEEILEGSPAKKMRSSRRVTRSSQVTVLDSDGDDEDYVPDKQSPKDGKVGCPVCQGRFPSELAVSMHIDTCTGEPPSRNRPTTSTQQSISSPLVSISKPIKKPEKLPHPHFDGLRDDRLRKKLIEQGISAGGNRQALEKRYTEWVLIWNSNCDSKNPRSKSDLKKDLDIWERTQGDRASTSNIAYATGLQIKDKDFDKDAWGIQNKSTFNDLAAQARAKIAAKRAGQMQSSTSGPVQEVTAPAEPSLLSAPAPWKPHMESPVTEE